MISSIKDILCYTKMAAFEAYICNKMAKNKMRKENRSHKNGMQLTFMYHVCTICLPRAHQSIALPWPMPVIISLSQETH
jgi:hypothetical protein